MIYSAVWKIFDHYHWIKTEVFKLLRSFVKFNQNLVLILIIFFLNIKTILKILNGYLKGARPKIFEKLNFVKLSDKWPCISSTVEKNANLYLIFKQLVKTKCVCYSFFLSDVLISHRIFHRFLLNFAQVTILP